MSKVKVGPKTLLYPRPAILVGANVDDKPLIYSTGPDGQYQAFGEVIGKEFSIGKELKPRENKS